LNPWQLRLATRILRSGGVIAYPTEAVFGLGCMPGFPDAVARILALKRRKPGSGLILVAAEIEQVQDLIDVSGINLEPLMASWPGPVSWVVPARNTAPRWVTGDHGSIAIRISAHPVVQALCYTTGPLVSTSANPSGRQPARSASRVRAYFPRGLDYIVPGTIEGAAAPSEIRDALSGAVLRKGG